MTLDRFIKQLSELPQHYLIDAEVVHDGHGRVIIIDRKPARGAAA